MLRALAAPALSAGIRMTWPAVCLALAASAAASNPEPWGIPSSCAAALAVANAATAATAATPRFVYSSIV
jgi:hypothetical protein